MSRRRVLGSILDDVAKPIDEIEPKAVEVEGGSCKTVTGRSTRGSGKGERTPHASGGNRRPKSTRPHTGEERRGIWRAP